jgi:hypothetical protein
MIDDAVFRQLRRKAAADGKTLQEVANQALRAGLRTAPAGFRLQLEGWEARPMPGVNLTDRDALLDLMEGR